MCLLFFVKGALVMAAVVNMFASHTFFRNKLLKP